MSVELLSEVPGQTVRPSMRKWLCRCGRCGIEFVARLNNVKSGHTSSCGCLQLALATTHGQADTPEYVAWRDCRNRCNNPNTHNFADYGGRGISVCKRWDDLENFLADMGPRPEGCSLDRIDNDLGYSPENCKWSTNSEQSRNKRNNRYIEAWGITLLLCEWAEISGLNQRTISSRIDRGWTPEDAITTHLRGTKVPEIHDFT